jgi:hypothetical protein
MRDEIRSEIRRRRPLPPPLLRPSTMLASVFLSSAGFSQSLRTAALPTAAQPRYASLMMSQPQNLPLELPQKLLDLGCDAELWSQVQPHGLATTVSWPSHTTRPSHNRSDADS